MEKVHKPSSKEYDVKMILKLSIGQAIYPRDGDDIDELIKISDSRMYMKKQNNPKYP